MTVNVEGTILEIDKLFVAVLLCRLLILPPLIKMFTAVSVKAIIFHNKKQLIAANK